MKPLFELLVPIKVDQCFKYLLNLVQIVLPRVLPLIARVTQHVLTHDLYCLVKLCIDLPCPEVAQLRNDNGKFVQFKPGELVAHLVYLFKTDLKELLRVDVVSFETLYKLDQRWQLHAVQACLEEAFLEVDIEL